MEELERITQREKDAFKKHHKQIRQALEMFTGKVKDIKNSKSLNNRKGYPNRFISPKRIGCAVCLSKRD